MAFGAEGVWNVEWLNSNGQRAYPLFDGAGRLDTSGTFTLPNDLIVDMILPVHADPTIDPSKFHVIGVGIFGTGVTVGFGYDGTTIGSISIDAAAFQPYSTFFLACTGDFFDTVGKVVIGSLDSVLQFAGSFQFDVANGRLTPTVVKPDIRGVNALYIKNGTELSDPINGDIVLQAGRNCLLNLFPGASGEPDRIVISAIEGAGLNQGCECDENADLPCIKTINGIAPDDSGNFTLLGDDCLLLEDIANGLKLNDQCATPCCGCDELKVVMDTLEFVVQQVNSLENLASRLDTALQATQLNLLSSKTGSLQ